MKRSFSSILGALIAVGISMNVALAGRECTTRTPNPTETANAVTLAQDVVKALDASGAQLALIGRVGSDQTARGIRYTHVSFALRDHPKGRWTLTHLLNVCGQGTSDLYDEGVGNFFLDEVFAFESKVIVPNPAAQTALKAALLGPQKRAMHEREYSVIANPWSTRYQNSNNWALELLAQGYAGAGEVRSRAQAQAWLKRMGFVPNTIRIGPGERAGSRLFVANVRYGDHPDTAWQEQRYEIASGDSVLDFVARHDTAAQIWVHKLGQAAAFVRGPVQQDIAPPPTIAAAVPAATSVGTSSRARILTGTRSLLQGYACREQGYLRQCQQLTSDRCEKMLRVAINDCFAPISDSELVEAERRSALGVVERVGLCSVERIDQYLGTQNKRAQTDTGQSCADFRAYK
jgi:hypothetical protein